LGFTGAAAPKDLLTRHQHIRFRRDMYQPDGTASYTAGECTYPVTANESDV